MSATPISQGNKPARLVRLRPKLAFARFFRGGWLLLALLMVLTAFDLRAKDNASVPVASQADFAKRAENAYQTAKAKFESQTNNAEAAWRFGQACFDWADLAISSQKRAEIAQQGINACQALVAQDPKSVPGHYYLGMNYAQLAQTKTLGALKIVGQMETEFTTVLGLDAAFDFAGSDRNLGLLYRDAPGWPASIGSRSKAREHLQNAVKIAPAYPENVLNLIESEIKWVDHMGAARDLKTLDDLWPKAQATLTGDDWASSWIDWSKRRDVVKKKIAQPTNLRPNSNRE